MPRATRVHREWFRPIEAGGRKSCPSCRAQLRGESVWSWGEYVRGKWRTVKHFCRACWPAIRTELRKHAAGCGCVFELKGYHCGLPAWLTLSSESEEDRHVDQGCCRGDVEVGAGAEARAAAG